MNAKKIIAASLVAAGGLALTSCATDADVVSKNISKAADQFEIGRRVVFVNGITDKYLLSIEGRCNIADDGNQLEVVCKTSGGEYKKHFLGLSDNVTYFVEQLEPANVSADHYRVIFKPEFIVPDIDRQLRQPDPGADHRVRLVLPRRRPHQLEHVREGEQRGTMRRVQPHT